MIPDGIYSVEFEGDSITELFRVQKKISELFDENVTFHNLQRLQGCHDGASNKERAHERLVQFAECNDLTIPQL